MSIFYTLFLGKHRNTCLLLTNSFLPRNLSRLFCSRDIHTHTHTHTHTHPHTHTHACVRRQHHETHTEPSATAYSFTLNPFYWLVVFSFLCAVQHRALEERVRLTCNTFPMQTGHRSQSMCVR